jgi:hypothetical protein
LLQFGRTAADELVDDSSAIAAALDQAVTESDGSAALGDNLCPDRRHDLLGEPGQLTRRLCPEHEGVEPATARSVRSSIHWSTGPAEAHRGRLR